MILEAFGTGNLPISQGMKTFLADYIKDGGLVFIKSQVARGRAMIQTYAPGAVIKELGIISGSDMTREAMITKLMVLKGLGFANDRLCRQMERNLAGEMSEDNEIYS